MNDPTMVDSPTYGAGMPKDTPISTSRTVADVFTDLEGMQRADVDWRSGRVFSLAYFAGNEVQSVADRAFTMFASTNGLNMDAFPSLRRMQSDVVTTVSSWLHGDTDAAGFMTSGGTESILLAVKSARQRGRAERAITRPNVVLPTSAHAAFEKACVYFDVESRRVDVDEKWCADPRAMAGAIDSNTVLLVGSAPQYPQGVIDPVAEIAALGERASVNVHVDACMGGVTLPFMEQLGDVIEPWDFRVPGVTSISVDLHKYGYTTKGASVLIHRNKRLRAYQTFATDNWLGGLYGSSGILGTKSGGPIAAAWAVMQYLGDDGYRDLTRRARTACLRIADGIASIDGLRLRTRPATTLLSFGATEGIDVHAIGDGLLRRGWYVDRQGPPPSLHMTVHAGHSERVDEFLVDLRSCVDESRVSGEIGEATPYGTVD